MFCACEQGAAAFFSAALRKMRAFGIYCDGFGLLVVIKARARLSPCLALFAYLRDAASARRRASSSSGLSAGASPDASPDDAAASPLTGS